LRRKIGQTSENQCFNFLFSSPNGQRLGVGNWNIWWLSGIFGQSVKGANMYYMIYSEDVADSLAQRKLTRPAHLARLQQLAAEERLLLAGPLPAIDAEDPQEAGFTGSLVVAEFASLDAAEAWAAADPYLAAGVYAHSTVKPFRKVLP
jgi:uncharacterized protein